MKLFEKGKLFGRFNVVDLLIILVILAVLGGGGLYLRKKVAPTVITNKVTYTVLFKEVPNGLVSYIVPGDNATEAEKLYKIGKVLSVSSKPATKVVQNVNAGTFVEQQIPGESDIYVKIQADTTLSGDGVNTVEDINADNSFAIKAGKSVTVKTPRFYALGYIISIDK